MNPQPKNKPFRSERYRKWIREQPCIACGFYRSVVHHEDLGEKAMGDKVSDLHSVPLCGPRFDTAGCHAARHNQGVETFWNGQNVALLCLKYLNKYLSSGNKL